MDVISDKLLVMIGGVLVALIAGFFSYLNLIVSKEQKVSEFREKWISSLREEIAAYCAAIAHLSSCFSQFKEKHKETLTAAQKLEFFTEHSTAYDGVRDNYNRITLRINPKDTDKKLKKINDDFLKTLEDTRSLYNSRKFVEAKKKCHDLRDAAIPLLKAEWDRVRDGEPAYQQAKKTAKVMLSTGVAASILALIVVLVATPMTPKKARDPAPIIVVDKRMSDTKQGDSSRGDTEIRHDSGPSESNTQAKE